MRWSQHRSIPLYGGMGTDAIDTSEPPAQGDAELEYVRSPEIRFVRKFSYPTWYIQPAIFSVVFK